MSSAGGGTGVGGGSVQPNFTVLEGANVQLPSGVQVDLSTSDGVAQARAALSPEQLAELEAVMHNTGFRIENGTFVPRDSYEMRQQLGVIGPASTTAGQTALDQELGEKVFGAAGLPSPYNANTTEPLYAKLQGTPHFTAAVAALNDFLANTAGVNQAGVESASGAVTAGAGAGAAVYQNEFLSRMQALTGQYPNGNAMEVLFLVFRESIQETNEDKKYFLLKLQEFNTMAEKISEYLSHLVSESQRLSEASEGQKYPEKVHISVEVKTFDLSSLDQSGNLLTKTQTNRSLDRAGLNDTIKDVESMQETIRNKRQMASTAFQNFDQKSNQLYNLMSSVLKTVNEMRSGIVRNML